MELGVRLRCEGGVGDIEVYEFCCWTGVCPLYAADAG